MSDKILDLSVNDVSLPELGWNGLIAGYHNVPVIFVSGDNAICEQAKTLFKKIETVSVKEGIGKAAISIHPEKSLQLITDGVQRAFTSINDYEPLKLSSPYTIKIQYNDELMAFRASWYPNAERIDELTVAFTCDDFMDCMRFFLFVL